MLVCLSLRPVRACDRVRRLEDRFRTCESRARHGNYLWPHENKLFAVRACWLVQAFCVQAIHARSHSRRVTPGPPTRPPTGLDATARLPKRLKTNTCAAFRGTHGRNYFSTCSADRISQHATNNNLHIHVMCSAAASLSDRPGDAGRCEAAGSLE